MEDPFLSATTVKKEQAGLSIKDMFFKYIRFLPLFIIVLFLSLLVAFIYLRYTTPIYQSNGALVVKDDNGGGGGGGTGGPGGDRFQQMFVLDNSINIKNEVEILKSRQLMKRVVEDLNLNFTYMVKGKISESNIYTSSPFRVEAYEIADSNTKFDLKIDIVNNHSYRINEGERVYAFGQVVENEYGKFRITNNPVASLNNAYRIIWNPTDIVINELALKMLVAPNGSTGIILISYEATNPKLAADVINQLMKEYKVATREDKNETNQRMLEFIDGRMKEVQKDLDSITGRLLAYQRANNIIDAEAQSASYFSKVEETDEKINEQSVQDNIALMVDAYLRDQKNAFNLVPSTLGLEDGTLGSLIGAYNVAQLERKSLIDANVPVANPKVLQKQDEIERLRINILESLRNLRKAISASVNRLKQTSGGYQARANALPEKEQYLLEIKAQQETKQTLFNLLLEKREQTAISLAGTISNMKVIEEARANAEPIKPDRKTTYMIALIVGLALPALIVFLSEALNDKVTNRGDVEKLTNVPIVGEVGHSFEKQPLVVRPNTRSMIAEQFRIIRSNLQYILTHNEKPVILITSSFSGEGKSYISSNLGAVMSLANKRTVVLEFDIRKPKLLSHLGIPKQPGIINFLLGKVTLEELPIPVPGYDNLFVVACGPVPPNPAELLLEPKLADLFTYLQSNFDVVIIDTAPVGMVSDAMALSQFANSTLYIVRQRYTFKKQISQIDELHTTGKLPKMSVLMNDVKVQAGYGYYGYGGYGYGKKSGYFEDEKLPATRFEKWFGWLDMKKWDRKSKS